MNNENDSDLFFELAGEKRPWSRKKALKHLKRKARPRRKWSGKLRPSR